MTIKRMKSAPVGVIDKVLVILELLDQNPGGLKLKGIAEQSRINKSTAHRFLTHLETQNYLFRDNAGTYMIGPKLTKLGTGINFHATLATICRGVLEKLRAATGETVNFVASAPTYPREDDYIFHIAAANQSTTPRIQGGKVHRTNPARQRAKRLVSCRRSLEA